MARPVQWKSRNIWPSVATSPSLNSVSIEADTLYTRMIPQADDQGRLSADIEMIKATVVPLRKEITLENLPALLEELSRELVVIYSASSEKVIQIKKWWEYQTGQWAYPSRFPPMDEWVDHLRYRKAGEIVKENWPP